MTMTDTDSIDFRLKDVLSKMLGISAAAIEPSTGMNTVQNWDSLKHVNLILAVEEEFGVEFPDQDIAQLTTYKALYDKVAQLIAK